MILHRRIWMALLPGFPFLMLACVDGGGGTGPNGEEEPSGSPPATPSIMQLVPLAQEPERGMYLTIHDASDNEDGFRIERKVGGGSFNSLTSLSPNTDNYTDWGLEMSTQYTYRIQAYNNDGNSNWNEKTQTAAGPEPGTVFLYPTSDAWVSETQPDRNTGTGEGLIIAYGSSRRAEAYIKFPYTEIPQHSIDIEFAELRLISSNVQFLYRDLPWVFLEDLASNWNENTVTWNNRPFGRGVGTDDAYVYNDGQPVYWNMTPIVKNWFEGITLNRGIRLYMWTGEGEARLSSRESDQKPLLTVDYVW